MRTRIDCCRDCPDRYSACHDRCEKYKTQRAELDAHNAERQARSKELFDAQSTKKVVHAIAERRAKARAQRKHH